MSQLGPDSRAVPVAAPADPLTDAVDAWQRAEIEAALREAEAGDFASDDEVAAAFGLPAPVFR
ncbi:hypothetical protein [Methylobacterium sp. J-048]|uniref:hypothetical protein n=1 Tax=Methylobacterium sp. J-048 TaxID=2836635 RepID=UPI001FB934CB|nr:hypothetical protein [Methylobacterium sp. J-048]